MHELLLEPLKYYDSVGKNTHEQNAKAHFASLVSKSRVNIEENRATVKRYNAELEVIDGLTKIISKFKTFKLLLIIAIIIGIILSIFSFSQFSQSTTNGILFLSIGLILVVVSVILLINKVNPKIKDTDAVRDEHVRKSEMILNEAWEQMAPLNALFRDDDALRLVEKTIPEFAFEDRFTKDLEKLFISEYDFVDLQNDECSMTDTLSGKFAGNPFVFGRRRVHTIGMETYHGTLTITWTESYRDSSGNLQTRHRSQVLHASVTKPKPYYSSNTFLAFGNQAAPDLNFSRENCHFERLSEKALERKIKRGENKLQRQAAKAMKKDEQFQEMANSEFDVLFGATDRDHEVQFRLMYTPLAQKNTVDLIKDKNYYGDDFDFTKMGKFNVIMSEHAQNWKMNTSSSNYKSYDVDMAGSKFVDFNSEFFKSVFFDFAPLFSVPAYLEEPCAVWDDDMNYRSNYTRYEHEVMANAADYYELVHDYSKTEAIMKTKFVRKENDADIIEITANSYETFNRLDLIPVLGGDGRFHNVPVHWVEYSPVSKTTLARISESISTASDNTTSYHGTNINIL